MKCKHPMMAYWRIGKFTENGRKAIEWKMPTGYDSRFYEQIEIPCGKCIACRVNYSRDWAVRCVCEARDHKENYFVTLTYDDEHIKDKEGNVGAENLVYFPTTDMDEVTAFVKRLRADQQYRHECDKDFWIDEIKFLAATEYGDQSQRPHAHIALFGVHHPVQLDNKPALKYWKTTDQGFILYKSSYFEKLWRNGNCIVGEISAASAQYIAKYSVKRTDQLHDWCDQVNVEYPKIRMSRRPGIGKNYFERNKIKLLKNGSMWIDGKQFPLPESWLSVGENNEETIAEAMSDALETLDAKLAEYEQRKVQTDKSREEEIRENIRRPIPDKIKPRKGV